MSIFLDVEDAIVERLRDKLSTLDSPPKIFHGSDLQNVKDQSASARAVYVCYNGIVGIKAISQNVNHVVAMTNEFVIWVVTKRIVSRGNAKALFTKVDDILLGTIKALIGWKPSPENKTLALAQSPAPLYDSDGFGSFPLVFTIDVPIQGDVR